MPTSSLRTLPRVDFAFSGPRGASSRAGPDRPSSRGTSTVLVSLCATGTSLPTYEEPHGGAEAGSHESVERADGVDLDGVVRHLCVLGRTHPAECGLHDCD
jgi:hypothetical protein